MQKVKPSPGASTVTASGAHRGNKAGLPSKPCVACGLTMSWRRRWARTWSEVRYCSEDCRRSKASHG
nr:DUF2256 domain-containing protein [uncultured Roseateles sp.]